MSTKREVLKLADQINAADSGKLVFHKERFQTLLKRVKLIANLLDSSNLIDSTRDLITCQALMALSITLEEILDYVALFSSADSQLASHIIKYGSDEEQFIKWTERLQHCAVELKLDDDVFDCFDELADFQDFQKDLAFLKKGIMKIIVLLNGNDNDVLYKSLEALVGHQSQVRSTYQTKTAPNANEEINPKKIKYDKVIGQGGIIGL